VKCVPCAYSYFIFVHSTDIKCFSGPVPILSITPNQTTIRGGEVITVKCLFGGNYLPNTEVLYSIYWTIMSHGRVIDVDDSNDVIGYVVNKPSQYCPDNNVSCCQFVSYLHINTSIISVPDETVVRCNGIFEEFDSSSSASSLSEYTIHVCSLNVLQAERGT